MGQRGCPPGLDARVHPGPTLMFLKSQVRALTALLRTPSSRLLAGDRTSPPLHLDCRAASSGLLELPRHRRRGPKQSPSGLGGALSGSASSAPSSPRKPPGCRQRDAGPGGSYGTSNPVSSPDRRQRPEPEGTPQLRQTVATCPPPLAGSPVWTPVHTNYSGMCAPGAAAHPGRPQISRCSGTNVHSEA